MAKPFMSAFARILLFQFLFWGVYVRWYKHEFVDWRLVLGSFLFGLVTLLTSWNSALGKYEAQKISDGILAKHQQLQRNELTSAQG
jgi:hypothetical protein